MKIGVISDTHGNLARIELAISSMGKIDALIHAGDFGNGFKEMQFAYPVYYVKGNCDWEDFETPEVLNLTLEGKKIIVTHGHKYDVKIRLMKLEYLAEQERADIVIFGHSHVPFKESRNNTLFLNPGSLHRPATSLGPSYAILTITDDNVEAEIFPLNTLS